MKKILLILLVALAPYFAMAEDNRYKDWATKGIVIPEVPIYGQRPMKEIGTQQTKFDSVVLKENISLSMADVLTFN